MDLVAGEKIQSLDVTVSEITLTGGRKYVELPIYGTSVLNATLSKDK